jgi:hypothetical protein
VPASTDNFAIGGTSAATWAIAGAGAIFLSATGVSALSENHASVIAQIGDTDPNTGEVVGTGFVLPNGNVILTANNVSNQVARGIGITVGGLLAIGTVQARSTADTETAALIGSYVESSALRAADVTLTGTSFDNNSAKAQAGSGGLLAGSGAEATTSGTAKVRAGIGAGSGIIARDIAINASHTVGFFASVDSLSAAALGASASVARNDFTSDVTASIGDGAGLFASGGLTATASNAFTRIGTDISANAAAGGGINGAGASSQTDITGNTHVLFGANMTVSTGTDGITALAYSTLNFADYVTLNTGGVIQGAGVESKLFATFNNDVTVADSDANAIGQFVTQGAINIGTFAQVNAVSNATVSTYGLASVGDSVSEIDLKVNQTAIVGTNNTLLAVGNVSITPGLDPTLFRSTDLSINAGAYGYIYGIIAIPGAFASASAASDAAVEIRNGAKVQSAGNIEIGAYHGTPDASATGKGKGYALYFIPVDIDDASVSKPVTGTVTIDGTVTAGLYHEQEILINCGQGGTCGPNSVAQLQLMKGAPVVVNGVTLQALSSPSAVVNSQSFNAAGYVSANFDPEVAPVMLLGVSANPVQDFMIGPMFAAGGNVTINADVIKGAGTVTALGAPTITLTNNSNAYIVLSQAYIPDAPGGRILFTGTAQQTDAPASLQFVGDNSAGGYDITIAMNYAGVAIGPGGPAFINSGNIVNLGGSINMTNATGWFGQLGDVMGRSVSEYAPNGGLVVSAVNPGQMFSAGSFPYSDWVNFMTFPGSDTGSAPALLNSTEQAEAAMWVVSFVANLYALGLPSRIDDPSQLAATWFPTDAQSLFSLKLLGMAGNMVSYLRGFQGAGVPLTDLTTNNNNVSHVFFGACAWSANAGCGDANFAGALSPVGFAYMLNGNSTGDEIWQPVVPYLLSRGANGSSIVGASTASNGYLLTADSYNFANIANSAPKTFGTPGLIKAFGGPVAIKANIININGTIETGRPNSWSVELPQSLMAAATTSQVLDHFDVSYRLVFGVPVLDITTVYRTDVTGGGEIARYQTQYDTGQQSLLTGAHNATAYEALAPTLTLQTTTTANSSDKKVEVTYNALTKTITTSDVNASSGGGFVLLDGKIINTGPTANAMINVNGGLGQVGIDNLTGLPIAINDVNNGSTVDGQPIVSTVRIIDRLQPIATNTTTYYYTPGVGMTVYKTSNGAVPVAGVTPIYAQTGSASAQYVPVEGARFQWQQQTQVQRDIIWGTNTDGSPKGLIDDITPWRFTSLQAGGNPWYFVAANGSLVGNDQAQGSVIIDVASKNTVFKETMGAQVTNSYNLFHGYGGCGGVDSICNYGFRESTNYQFPNPGFASWNYDFILGAKLTLTSSVKADNPFGINFFGNATASLNIASNAGVSLNGNITNPSGKTTISVTSGALTQAPTSVFQTGDLAITVAGGIGSVSQPLTAIMSSGTAVRVQSGTQAPAGGVASANNTYLKFNSGALIDKVAAGTVQTGYADVTISAVGDLERATRHADGSAMGVNDVNLSGSNIALTSQFGGVGSATDPLVMSANYTTNASGSITGGVVTVTAVGDVGLTQVAGFNAPDQVDLRVGSIVTNGDVYLKIVNGALVDASGKTGSSTLSDTQVAQNSQRLHLTLADGAAQNAIDTGITSFENLYDRSYVSYFSLTANGAVSGGAQVDPADLAAAVSAYRPLAEAAQIEAARQQGQNFAGTALTVLTDAQVLDYAATLNAKNGVFVLDAAKLALYRPLAAAALKIAAPTDAQVQAYANAQYQTYATVFERGSGTNWSAQAQFATQQDNFAFHLDPGGSLAQSLTSGSVWDPKQLIADINQTPIAVGNTAATVAGRRVSVEATGGGIGQTAAAVSITLDDLRAGTLSPEQKKALAGAAPGAVVAVAADGTEYPTDNLPAGVAITGIRISQAAPVFVSASSTVNGKADTDIYIQATGTPFAAGQTLRIGSMFAPGNINLVAGSGIVASTEPTVAAARIIAGGDLSLLTDSAGSGSIGDQSTPLTYSAGGRLVAAVAGKDIYLTAISDTTLGRLQAGDTLSIETTAGGIFSYLANIAITGKNVILTSAGDIGDSSTPLLVQVGATGALSGSAAGAAYIYGPTLATDAAPRTLHVGAFSANGPISLTSDFDLTAQSLTSASGNIVIGAGAMATIASAVITAQTGNATITATAVGDLEIGVLTAPGQLKTQAGGTLTVDAGGALTSRADAIEVIAATLSMQAKSLMSAARTIAVTTLGDAVVGKLTSAFSPPVNTDVISVAAGGASHAGQILGNGDGQANFTVTRPNGAVKLAAASGMGTAAVPLTVDTPWLSAEAAQGDIHIRSLGDIHITTLAGKGALDLTTDRAITFDNVKGNDIVLKSNGALNVGNVEVTNSVTLTGTVITGTIVQTPGSPGPLSVTITGPNGTLAQNAVVVIDPPATVIPQLLAVDATITNIGPSFTVQNGYVSGQFTLLMNGQTYIMNNRSPAPLGWPTVQLYQNGTPFYFSQNNNFTYTSGFVVDYGRFANTTALSLFNGMSFVRDIPRDMWDGGVFDDDDGYAKRGSAFHLLGTSPEATLESFLSAKAIETIGGGPAVNIDGLK